MFGFLYVPALYVKQNKIRLHFHLFRYAYCLTHLAYWDLSSSLEGADSSCFPPSLRAGPQGPAGKCR